jgi:hypothetical protein
MLRDNFAQFFIVIRKKTLSSRNSRCLDAQPELIFRSQLKLIQTNTKTVVSGIAIIPSVSKGIEREAKQNNSLAAYDQQNRADLSHRQETAVDKQRRSGHV